MHAQITLEERYAINVMRKHHYSIRAIARELGRAPSTVSRELRRNLRPTGRYVPASRTPTRRPGAEDRGETRASGLKIWEVVERYLRMDWSPEQVSGFLQGGGHLEDQPRDDLHPRLGRQARRRGSVAPSASDRKKRCRKRYRSPRLARKTRR